MINNFFASPFNGDLHGPDSSMENCSNTRKDVQRREFSKSNYNLISKNAHALYFLYNSDNLAYFFKMAAAGFSPLPENNNIMIIPLKETILTHKGVDHHGFLTSLDSCDKNWFIRPDGIIVGQYNNRTMSIREPKFTPIPSSTISGMNDYHENEEDGEEEEDV